MDDERNESEINNLDEVMLPGFRFHPTDEELVGFYLKRKIQQRPLSVELIKQVDIYKHDPWDLPKLATIGEKEWYFYCPRDRKYRNSARPNRVTGAGFWKATGTDRPIYNSEGSKCIGLKKSLVFYKGRAAKGTKTDWMMHEFRLPSTTDPSISSKRYIEKHIPANDAWAICRIFKKTNNSTPQRTLLSHSWVSPVHETTSHHDTVNPRIPSNPSQLSLDNFSLPQRTNTTFRQFGVMNNLLDQSSSIISTYNTLDNVPTSYKSIDHQTNEQSLISISGSDELATNYTFSSSETSEPSKSTINDASSLLLNMSSSIFGDFGKNVENSIGDEMLQNHYCSRFSLSLPHDEIQGHYGNYGGSQPALVKDSNSNNVLYLEEQLGSVRSIGFPYGLPPLSLPDAWKSNIVWDSS